VSPEEFSVTSGPQNESSGKNNIPALIHDCHFAPTYPYCIRHNDRDVSMQGNYVSRRIHFRDHGSQKIRTGTHRSRTVDHPILGDRMVEWSVLPLTTFQMFDDDPQICLLFLFKPYPKKQVE